MSAGLKKFQNFSMCSRYLSCDILAKNVPLSLSPSPHFVLHNLKNNTLQFIGGEDKKQISIT